MGAARDALLSWWREVPRHNKKYARLSARGAVASQLLLRFRVDAVRVHFEAQAPRLSVHAPAFLREVRFLLGELEAEALGETVAEIVDELEQAADDATNYQDHMDHLRDVAEDR